MISDLLISCRCRRFIHLQLFVACVMGETAVSESRTKIRQIVDSERFNNIVFIAILASSISIGFETYDWGDSGNKFLVYLDWFFMTIFVTEILFRIYAMRFDFFKDPWCVFDFLIVGIALFPSTGVFRVFRVFRVLRAFRLVSRIPELKLVAESLIFSVRGLTAVATLLSVVIYVFAVLSTVLFQNSGVEGELYFGTLGKSLFSLFQVMTLESWSNGIVRFLIEEEGWWVGFYFVVFIFMTTFTFLNMFVAIFTNTVVALEADSEEGINSEVRKIQSQLDALVEEIQMLRMKLEEE